MSDVLASRLSIVLDSMRQTGKVELVITLIGSETSKKEAPYKVW